MALGIVADDISEIMERMRSIPVSVDKSSSITENIKHHLLSIKHVIAPAQEQNDSNEMVAAKLDENDSKKRDWVGQVTDVFTDLFDLLEDLHLRLPADAAPLPKQSMIASFFSLCNLTSPHSPLLQLKQIEKRLSDLAADATKLPLKSGQKLTNFSDAMDEEIEIVGRERQKDEIIDGILREKKVEGAVPVVVIAGIQGAGKTKLAKFVWDDEKVKSDFDLMIWIDGIRDEFYADFIVKRMIHESVMKKLEEDSVVMDENESLNLGKALSGSRFFLVLDDLRNEDRKEWNKLLDMLREAAKPTGGAVIITTQSDIVAKVVSPYAPVLEELSEEDSWSLFEQIAGGRGPSDSKIREAQKKMVKMCHGIPIAILTMARLVSSREAITESEIDQVKDKFMQEMQLIYYNDLPSRHLRQCFAYLSFIYSSVYDRVKPKKLVRFWMAEGFLGPLISSSPQQLEDLGLECIQEFGRRSILRCFEDEDGIIGTCCLNGYLMRDLSAFVAGDDSFCMEDPDMDVKERIHRVLLTSGLDVSNGIPESLFKNNKNLRTILFPWDSQSRVPHEVKLSWSACNAIFSGFRRLRVLTLRDLGMKMLPDSIGELKSLRYLDLSRNNMKKLPNSIGELKRLWMLILSHCHELKELPDEVKDLVSLRHLEIKACLHLKRMPSALKKLTWLQTLSHFVANTSKKNSQTGGLWELISLNNLRGELEILHLERLQFNESDQDGHAYLIEKQHLQSLTLRWNHDDEEHEGHHPRSTRKHSGNDDQIYLGHLEPHPNLQRLSIVGYEGIEFSHWLSSLKNLVQFSLYNCSKCEKLPPLDQLPKLKTLKLQRLDALKFITDDHDNERGLTEPFPSLRDLQISDCPNLASWWKRRIDDNARFGPISTLQVEYCPKLDCMPLYPNVDKELVLKCSSVKPLLETLNYRISTTPSRTASDTDSSPPLSKLETLIIENVEERSPLPEEWLKSFTSLKHLSIEECKSLKSLMEGLKYLGSLDSLYIKNCTEVDLLGDEWKGLINLRRLYITEVPELKSLPEGIKHLTSLQRLSIESCPELTDLTEGIGNLKSLKSLWIEECPKLASLPQGMSSLTSLSMLGITNCSMLLPRCQEETGDDWPQIKHIEERGMIYLSGTSKYDD